MNNKKFKIVEEFYDISRYIGLVDPSQPIYESYQAKDELIALTRNKLLIIKEDSLDFEVSLTDVKGCSFSTNKEMGYRLDLNTSKEVISLAFNRKRETLRFVNNVLKGLI